MEQQARRRGNAIRAAVTVATAAAMVGMLAPAAAADPLPGGLGPCLGSGCPDVWNEPNNGPIAGYDENINIYVGGDFLVREAAAEAEGKIVTLGQFDMDKRDGVSQVYNVGVVGVGSRVAPPNGSDYLTVGGDVTVAAGERLLAEEGTNSGRVAYAGSLTGTVNPLTAPRPDPEATAPFTGLRPQLTEASRCYAYEGDAHRATTGDWERVGDTFTFTGDGTSAIQIFDVDTNLVSETNGNAGFTFTGIPAGATVLVNVYGDARTVATFMGTLPNPGLRERLLWNFPDATDLTLTGPAQFQGSVLVGQPTSTTTLSMSGTNGRFYSAGSLTHTSSGASGGQEIHAYPFDGDLPTCGPDPTPTPTPTDPTPTPTPTDPTPTPTDPTPTPTDPTPTPTDPTPTPTDPTPTPTDPTPTPTDPTPTPTDPTPTPTDPTPTPTDPTPTPTDPTPTPTDPTPTPTDPTPTPTDPTPTPTDPTPTWKPSPSPSHPGELPDTGSRGGEWIIGSIAAALVAAGGTVLVATRRARRRTY
ncbi:cellulosome anchoring protein cohesin subunit [Streptomyces sp. CBMAI 2042]|uniref:choice-of-anchor A family protein n=1 Tax=Streptomyces sp. CBMAI 2042 TaxID=2305222 RepID=UPI000F0D2985|nr:choice-of-anchor A family protein [Streptomyces sp. CBMAI 2042]RLV69510.1 cellulosome anchoring protein cohesin subunit [Streptomyces sp. CBMAI 2042]